MGAQLKLQMASELDHGRAPLVSMERVPLDPGGCAAIVTLHRPEQLNPLDWDTVIRLEQVLTESDQDPTVRAVLITGEGRAFSSGGDLKKYQSLQRDPAAFPRFLDDFHRTLSGIARMKKPVVALVNGIAVAGGLELALSCDFAFIAESARISDGHLTFGQMGGGGVLTLLPRVIGPSKARELIWSGRWLTAQDALAWGLVNRVVADDQLLQAGLEVATAFAERSPLAIAESKYVMNTAWSEGTGIEGGLKLERERTALYCLTSHDAEEGLAAFVEKRQARFLGR